MRIQTTLVFTALIVAMVIVPGLPVLSIASASSASAQAEPVIVNVENFVRAETAAQFDRVMANAVGVNRFFHLREPAPLDKQTVIRMNRDTIYSAALVDISKGATLTVPDAGDRYMSVMVVNEDHYLNKVIREPGEYELTVEEFGTPNDDGSFTIHFGGEPGSTNHLPIAEGWNYSVRLYQPREKILDGSWTFPDVKPVASK